MSVLIFIIILGILVFVHEVGHFSAAKRLGVRVDEFAIGFPPRLISKKWGETTYALNALPVGGYVKLYGEDREDEEPQNLNNKNTTNNKIKLTDAPRWKQAVILSSGILGNLIFAWLLLSIGFMFGLPTSEGGPFTKNIANQKLIITSVMPNSPAEKAGIKIGDEIIELAFDEKTLQKPDRDSASTFISTVPENQFVDLTILRQDKTIVLKPKLEEGIISGKPGIGIAMEYAGILKLPLHKAFVAGSYSLVSMTKGTIYGVVGLTGDAINGKASLLSVSGPVGIAVMVGDAGKSGFIYLLILTVLISINLAIINLIPFPALDGGRLFFLMIESILRKPISPRLTSISNQVGLVLLLVLMAVITYKDIVKLF